MSDTKLSEKEGKSLLGPSVKQLPNLPISALLALMAASATIPLLISSPSILGDAGVFVRGQYFWPKLIFFEIILLIGWGAGQPIAQKMRESRWMVGGAAVTIWVVWNLAYGLFLLLIILSSFVPDDKIGWSIAFGFFLAASTTVVIAAVAQSVESQLVGIEQLPPAATVTATLTAQLRAAESMLPASEASTLIEIKRVRERISYSIPSVGKIAASTTYAELATEVRLLLDLVTTRGSTERIIESCRNANLLLDRVRTELSGQ
jgi:hypothetical protein